MAALGVPFCVVQKAQVGTQSLFSFLSLVQANSSACYVPAQTTAFGLFQSSTHTKLQSGQEQPESC